MSALAPAFERSYRALSYAFRIRTDLSEVDAGLDRLLAPFRVQALAKWTPTYVLSRARSNGQQFLVHRGRKELCRSESASGLLNWVLSDVTDKAVVKARDFLVIHAGAVSWQGCAIVLPAPPDSGKTTLSAALTTAGFRYLTDEAALISPATGMVHPFPRALKLERPTLDVMPSLIGALPEEDRDLTRALYHISPDDLRAGAVGGPAPLRYVIAPSYRPHRGTALEPTSRAEAVVILAENSYGLARFGRRGVQLLTEVVRGARCFRLRMGDLESAVRAVVDLVVWGDGSG